MSDFAYLEESTLAHPVPTPNPPTRWPVLGRVYTHRISRVASRVPLASLRSARSSGSAARRAGYARGRRAERASTSVTLMVVARTVTAVAVAVAFDAGPVVRVADPRWSAAVWVAPTTGAAVGPTGASARPASAGAGTTGAASAGAGRADV